MPLSQSGRENNFVLKDSKYTVKKMYQLYIIEFPALHYARSLWTRTGETKTVRDVLFQHDNRNVISFFVFKKMYFKVFSLMDAIFHVTEIQGDKA